MADGNAPLTPDQEKRLMQEFQGLLDSLPRPTVTEDIKVLERVYELVQGNPPSRTKLGECQRAFYSILNSTSLEKSRGDVSLQDILLKLVHEIAQEYEIARKSNYIIPFLVVCLKSKEIDNRDYAALLVHIFAEHDSGFSRKIGESDAVTSLIRNIGRDQEGEPCAIMAMLQLCLELENRELAVSKGVTTAVMETVVKRVHVEEVLQTLEVLSKQEEAIAEMEEFGILKYLFEILGEDVRDEAKGYCVDIIHAMCHASSAINTRRQIKEVENARQKLESLVCDPTKVNGVLLKLQEWANE